ncbi:response regulator transcription factor [Limibacter armeniacum]|uniref:response regulator transcription factor n=1 Tax=Limibacter armeniacum TaxID=466084 RepID=UPI002FE623BE
MRILIIEDEPELAASLESYLTEETYRCEVASTLEEAMDKIHDYEYDCILLDLMLPDGNGFQLLEELRRMQKQEGVIIISAKGDVEDKVKGLQIGADDYLSKPFHLSELQARIYSVVRRKHFENSNVITFQEVQVDLLAKSVEVNGVLVLLTRSEYDLLTFFIKNKGKVISKMALAEHLSGDMADMIDNYGFVYAHTKNLRKKLMEAGSQDYIKTVYGMGYKWDI